MNLSDEPPTRPITVNHNPMTSQPEKEEFKYIYAEPEEKHLAMSAADIKAVTAGECMIPPLISTRRMAQSDLTKPAWSTLEQQELERNSKSVS